MRKEERRVDLAMPPVATQQVSCNVFAQYVKVYIYTNWNCNLTQQNEHVKPHMVMQGSKQEINRDPITKGQCSFEPFWFMAQCHRTQKKSVNPLSNLEMLESLSIIMKEKFKRPTKSNARGESARRFKGPRTLSAEYRKPSKESKHHKQMFALMMSISEDKKRFKLPSFPDDSNARD